LSFFYLVAFLLIIFHPVSPFFCFGSLAIILPSLTGNDSVLLLSRSFEDRNAKCL
jgi:hypothetical protein